MVGIVEQLVDVESWLNWQRQEIKKSSGQLAGAF